MSNDTFLVQYGTPPQLGVVRGQEVYPLGYDLDGLLGANAPHAADLMATLEQVLQTQPVAAPTLVTPVRTQEIWGAGVTYKRSEEAREAESNNSTVYTRVYSATRPEVFYKSAGYDVVGLGEPVGIRYDTTWNVPEPELVVVLNSHLEVIGFTIGNDMSSRDIEGENPLYLPQAKIYEASCALGPRIWLQPGATEFPELTIELEIKRGGQVAFSGTTSTSELHRSLAELVDYLGRCKRFPYGVLFFTGTGVIPNDDFTLVAGDVVRIRVDPIGELVNTVRVVGQR